MKQIIPFLMAAGIMMLVPGCKEKKQPTDIVMTKYEPKRLVAPIRMPADVRTSQVEWMGRQYSVVIERLAADSLPMVKDETGQEFVDNKITLTIKRSDGSVFYHKVFTKAAFASYLTDTYRQKALLSSMIFHEVDNNELEFAASISMPDSDDEFIPLEISVNKNKGIQIERDVNLDTWGENEDERDSE